MNSGDYKYIRQAGDWPNWRREVCQEWMGTAVHQLYRVIALKLRQRPPAWWSMPMLRRAGGLRFMIASPPKWVSI